MARFLLWNINRRPLEGLVVRLVQQHKVDVVVLVERPASDGVLLQALQTIGLYARVESHERFGVYTRLGPTSFTRLTPPVQDDRTDIWKVRPRASTEILLVAVHGLDRRNYSEEGRS